MIVSMILNASAILIVSAILNASVSIKDELKINLPKGEEIVSSPLIQILKISYRTRFKPSLQILRYPIGAEKACQRFSNRL